MFGSLLTMIGGLIGDTWLMDRANNAPQTHSPDYEWMMHGARLVVDGTVYFYDWKAAMIREYGDRLDRLSELEWDEFHLFARTLSRSPVADWRRLIRDALQGQ